MTIPFKGTNSFQPNQTAVKFIDEGQHFKLTDIILHVLDEHPM